MRDHLNNQNVPDSLVVLLLGLALGVYSLVGFFTAPVHTAWILSPYLFPLLLAVFAVLLSAALFAEGRSEAEKSRAEAAAAKHAARGLKQLLAVALTGILYCALLAPLGFIPSTVLFLAALLWLLGERRRWMIAAVALLTPLVLYALFGLALGVRLP